MVVVRLKLLISNAKKSRPFLDDFLFLGRIILRIFWDSPLFLNNHCSLQYSGNELRRPDSCALPDFTNCLLRSQFAKSCKCSESKRATTLSIETSYAGQFLPVCYSPEIARTVPRAIPGLRQILGNSRACFALFIMRLRR